MAKCLERDLRNASTETLPQFLEGMWEGEGI